MAKDVLLEIGTEELPVEFISAGLTQLAKLADFYLYKKKIKFQKIEAFATPCRLILVVSGVDEKQISEAKEIRGPAEEAAFDKQGKPTSQAIGFARSQGVKVSELAVKECGQKRYVFAVHKTRGESTKKLLKTVLPDIIKGLSFSKMMRWNSHGVSFGRPIRWITALWDKEPVRFDFSGLKSSNLSRGHKFLKPGSFTVKEVKSFGAELKKRYCLINIDEKVTLIERRGNALVKRYGGRIYVEGGAIEEIGNLVECPLCLLGKFSPCYLDIPDEIVTEVIVHQEKCLPVKDKKGKLLPLFVIVANRKDDRSGEIKKGYQMVMEARLKDAEFFYRQDLKKPLKEKAEKLKEIIFQEKLGTIFDKTERLSGLADFFSPRLNLNKEESENYKLASRLCKTDLLTEVVGEFPNLQGVMGGHYAFKNGENKMVSKAVVEHYLPRFPGDALPRTKLGALLSISDRLDTLVGYFYLGLVPSGSEDPYSLRRQTNGLLEILIKFRFPFNLEELIEASIQIYGYQKAGLKDSLIVFLRQRLTFILRQTGYSADFIEAALASGFFLLPELLEKLEALKEFGQTEIFPDFLKAYQRLNNILRSVPEGKIQKETVDETMFREKAEENLCQVFKEIKAELGVSDDFNQIFKKLSRVIPLINVFFEQVMVMVPDEALCSNRLFLLNELRGLFLKTADFSQIKQN